MRLFPFIGFVLFIPLSYSQVKIEIMGSTDQENIYCYTKTYIQISATGYDLTKINVTATNGTIEGISGKYTIKPEKPEEKETVEVFYNKKSIGKKTFTVKNIPDPVLCFANECGSSVTVSINSVKGNSLIAKIDKFLFSSFPEILSYEVRITDHGTTKTLRASNAQITDQMADLIKTNGPGGSVIFSNIECKMPFGEIRILKPFTVSFK